MRNAEFEIVKSKPIGEQVMTFRSVMLNRPHTYLLPICLEPAQESTFKFSPVAASSNIQNRLWGKHELNFDTALAKNDETTVEYQHEI